MNLSEIVVDADALRANFTALKGLTAPGTRMVSVVKGNAYGHGLELVASLLDDVTDLFQVDDLDELRRLRQVTARPALVLGYVASDELSEALRLGCEFGVYSEEYAASLATACRDAGLTARIHLEIDALLGRLGILAKDLDEFLNRLGDWPELALVGVFAHFANIEDTTDLTHAQAQRDVLLQCEAAIEARGFHVSAHISATSGLIALEAERPNPLVRVGVGLYGMYPSIPLSRSHRSLGLKPVLTWVTRLAQVKELPAKYPIGYGLTFVTSTPTKIGIVPQGYSDGYDRGLSNSGEVLVGGKRCAVLGRIAMNMFAIDLSLVDGPQAGDPVVLIGAQGNDKIDAEELAVRTGTINYEITSRISPHLPRVLSS